MSSSNETEPISLEKDTKNHTNSKKFVESNITIQENEPISDSKNDVILRGPDMKAPTISIPPLDKPKLEPENPPVGNEPSISNDAYGVGATNR